MKTRKKKKKDRYLELIQCVPLRPIRSESELDEAVNMVDYLIDRGTLNEDEKDYMYVLGHLIEQYEDEHVVFERRSDAQMLNSLIESKGVTQAQVAKDCRIAESTISVLLSGARKMNRSHIGKLSRYFHVEPGVFSFEP